MLTREVMGAVALAILWVNALLIAAAAVKQLGQLLARRRALGDVIRGRVTRGDGREGAFAVHRVAQVGRTAEGAATILFHDRGAQGEIFGGALGLASGEEREIGRATTAEVWLTPAELARAAACASKDELESALALAKKAKGYPRDLQATVTVGTEVFVSDRTTGGAALVATLDPRALLVKKVALGALFVVGELACAAGCTALALSSPWFGPSSTAGGALGLVYFLLVQPAGTAVRDAMLTPNLAPVRGRWDAA